MSTAYHKQTNGQSERVVQCMKDYLRMYINYRQDDWFDYLAMAEFAYNNSQHSSFGIRLKRITGMIFLWALLIRRPEVLRLWRGKQLIIFMKFMRNLRCS